MIRSEHLYITTARATLAATFYRPAHIISAVMIAPATGIKRRFYHAFATFLAKQGYAVLTFDNEDIGDSRQDSLKHSTTSLVTCGQVDMPAVLDKLMTLVPNQRYHLIGHSAGGQLFGLMHNLTVHLSSVFNVGCSSGSLRHMRPAYRIKAEYFMNIHLPVSTRLFGYAKTKAVGMGENLPKQIAHQWRHWCNHSGYIQTDLDTHITTHYYHDVSLPSLWLHASDDDIATLANVQEMIAVFPKITSQINTLDPKALGLNHIGHMKFFSRQNRSLWTLASEWLTKHSR